MYVALLKIIGARTVCVQIYYDNKLSLRFILKINYFKDDNARFTMVPLKDLSDRA